MKADRVCVLLVSAVLAALPAAGAHAQSAVQDRWPDDAFQNPPKPAAKPAAPSAAKPAARAAKPAPAPSDPDDDSASAQPAAPTPRPPPAQPARAVACSGAFAKDSSHLKLAAAFESRNVVFTEVDGADGSKLMASVLFPKDPKRRLEVLWNDESARRETSLIVINGQSAWTAPKGLRLGLPIAALEKLNGRPFRMRGFGVENEGSVVDWLGGALDVLPGNCQAGVRLKADAKATPSALAAANVSQLMSSDELIRAVKPAVAEIIIGYGQ